MSQRDSGYERKERDCYETPEWVTEALLPHIPNEIKEIWEPAAGSGKIVGVLRRNGFQVRATDINDPVAKDFFNAETYSTCQGIITNPPYQVAPEFIERALQLMIGLDGIVAMLLRTDFDHAKTRKFLFGECRAFAKKLVLTRRIRWIEGSKGQPSFNHAWFIWDQTNQNAPTLAYD